MIEVTFDEYDLKHAVAAAARVAPVRGDAMERCAGIALEWDGDDTRVVVAATNGDSTYRQSIPAKMSGDQAFKIRMPSVPFSKYVSKLGGRDTPGKIRLALSDDSMVTVSEKRSKATFAPILGAGYPVIPFFDDVEFATIDDFGAIVKSVLFATGREHPFDGVHFNGAWVGATDKYKGAVLQCDIPVDKPITVPMTAIAGTFNEFDVVQVAAIGERLVLKLDKDTQMTANIYAADYPPLDKAVKTSVDGAAFTTKVRRKELIECLQRIEGLYSKEDLHSVHLIVTDDSIELRATIPSMGEVQEFCDHTAEPLTPLAVTVDAALFLRMLSATKAPTVSIGWPKRPTGFITLDNDAGWFSLFAAVNSPDTPKI